MKFDAYTLLNPETAKIYAAEALRLFETADDLDSVEIGDGNINYVFRVWSKTTGKSVIIKQADTLLRSSGRPLDQNRNNIEAKILMLEGKFAPGFVPEVYRHDPVMAATAMEDVSEYKNLRKELMAGRVYPHLAENLSEFLALVLLPATDLVMDKTEKKRLVGEFINPELCDITENLVLTDPFVDWRNKNRITAGNETFVETNLYRNAPLCAEAAALREHFMNYAQTMLHGDLHSGSVFANETGIKVLDPEFAFYGPMGYDIGNVIGNFFFPWANKHFTEGPSETTEAIAECIRRFCTLMREKLSAKYDELVTYPLYRNDIFKKKYIDAVMADSYGYAGTEMIRRTVGAAKVMELTTVTDAAAKIPMERALITMGMELILNRERFDDAQIVPRFEAVLASFGGVRA